MRVPTSPDKSRRAAIGSGQMGESGKQKAEGRTQKDLPPARRCGGHATAAADIRPILVAGDLSCPGALPMPDTPTATALVRFGGLPSTDCTKWTRVPRCDQGTIQALVDFSPPYGVSESLFQPRAILEGGRFQTRS